MIGFLFNFSTFILRIVFICDWLSLNKENFRIAFIEIGVYESEGFIKFIFSLLGVGVNIGYKKLW